MTTRKNISNNMERRAVSQRRVRFLFCYCKTFHLSWCAAEREMSKKQIAAICGQKMLQFSTYRSH